MQGGGVHREVEGDAVEEGEGAVARSVEEHEVQRGRTEHPDRHRREPGPDAARIRRRRQAGEVGFTRSAGGGCGRACLLANSRGGSVHAASEPRPSESVLVALPVNGFGGGEDKRTGHFTMKVLTT